MTNNIPNTVYAELLKGVFSAPAATHFTFSGVSFSGLMGGDNSGGDLLTFDTTGDAAGTYTDILTFDGASTYAGLSDYALGPITVNVSVEVTGGAGGVPEPASWAMMLVGFSLIGGLMRSRSKTLTRRRAA